MAVIKAWVDTWPGPRRAYRSVVKLDHRPGEMSGRLVRKVESVEDTLMTESPTRAR